MKEKIKKILILAVSIIAIVVGWRWIDRQSLKRECLYHCKYDPEKKVWGYFPSLDFSKYPAKTADLFETQNQCLNFCIENLKIDKSVYK